MAETAFPWLNRAEYPFASHTFTHQHHRLHYIDEGQGPTLLFVHGTPSWSFDFRKVIRQLSSHYRCIALDHLGFGLSDKPVQGNYALEAHVGRLAAFIQHLQLQDIVLVVHDFGGPIAVAAGLQMPDRIRGVLAINTWLWSSEGQPEFVRFSKVLRSPILPFLYLRLNFSARFLLPGSFGAHKLTRHLRQQYTRPFPNAASRHGTLAFARSLLNDQAWFQSLWDQGEILRNWEWHFAWGMQDKFVGPSYLAKFQAQFPQAQTLKLQTAGHFPQEEQPEAIAQFIRDQFPQSSGVGHQG